jgi:hypothetical protein
MQVTGVLRRIMVVNFTFADFATGVFTPVAVLPNGAQILSGQLVITTASNAASTDTLQFGIAGTANRNLTATDAKTVAKTALTALTTVSGETLGITRTLGGAAGTQGAGFLEVEYLIPNGSDFIVGDLPKANDANEST